MSQPDDLIDSLPSQPGTRILRAAEAAQWIDGYAFMRAAEQQAQRLRNDSEATLRQARADAFDQARKEGDEQIAALLADTAARADAWLLSLQPSIAELAVDIARQIIGELPSEERVLRCTRQALSAFRQDQALTLLAPRAEVDALRRRLDQEGLDHIRVAADDQLAPGDACLCSPFGRVELGVDTQLQHIRSSLLGQDAQDVRQ
jgi:type III secretion protein L